MIELIILKRLLDTAANLDAQLGELLELRKRVKKALLLARYHNQKRRTRNAAARALQHRAYNYQHRKAAASLPYRKQTKPDSSPSNQR